MYEQLHPVSYYFYPLFEQGGVIPERVPEFQAALRDMAVAQSPALLYVHVPYCHDLCRFCPFHVKVKNDEAIYERYSRALCEEMNLLGSQPYVAGMRFAAVYFGGGSPSILPAPQLRQIFSAVKRNFSLLPGAELSFEGEPRTLSDEVRLDLLKEFGFQRVSFGLQTFDPVQRKRFNIAATLDDVERCSRNARARRFEDINVDMMYDLPGQTVASLREDLARLGDAGYDSVDYYNLHYFAFPVSFRAQMESGKIPPKPDQATHFELFREVRSGMAELGYRYAADQIFSRSGELSEYFRLLWGGGRGAHDAETLAVGSSARGYLGGRSYMNEPATEAYMTSIEQGRIPISKVSARLDVPENRGAAFMTKFFELDKRHSRALASVDDEVWARLVDWGLLEERDDRLRLTEEGQLWTTNIMVDLFEHSQRAAAGLSLVTIARRPGIRTGSF